GVHSPAIARVSLCALLCALPALASPPNPAYLVKDVDTGLAGFPGKDPESIGPIRKEGDAVYLSLYTLDTGSELWKSSGSGTGIELVKDLEPGTGGSAPNVLGTVGGALLFWACQADSQGLWRTDGSFAGTSLVTGFSIPSGGICVGSGIVVNGTLFFTAN